MNNTISTLNCSVINLGKHLITAKEVLQFTAPLLVILGASFGNMLVILSVIMHKKLRMQNHNLFVLSLALADCLVAFFVMPFNLTQIITDGYWPFGAVMCDIYNSNDVFLSTASIIHLCCISMDRYIAIVHPLTYEAIMTKSRVAFMLLACWFSSIFISYIPIYSGLYTTKDNLQLLAACAHICNFKVNQVYAIVSSTVSFWIPCFVMVGVYIRIFKEARKHENSIYKLEKTFRRRSNRNTKMLETPDTPNHCSNSPSNKSSNRLISFSQTSVQEGQKLRREHKAAKTLGIIMGCFIICWLPFFLWYSITNICGETTCQYPGVLVDVFFWIGYANSALNPFIYAFYNREFRYAFRQILGCKRRITSGNSYALTVQNSFSDDRSLGLKKRCRHKKDHS